MNSSACPHFDTCSAPLCPLDGQSLEHGSWFGDEEVCVRRDLHAPWIARQRKIARTTDHSFVAGSFTHRMLLRDFIVRRGLTGLDPDKGPSDRTEADWMKAHRERRPLSDEERAFLRARVEKTGAFSSGRRPPGGAQSRVQGTSAAKTASVAWGAP
jgi:hypothetical protein